MNSKIESNSNLNKSVVKALSILDLFSDNKHLTAKEIVESLDGSAGSIYPMLHTLEMYGYLEQNEDKKYRLGFQFLSKAELVLERINLRKRAQTELKKLRDRTNATVHLGVQTGGEIVYIEKYSSKGPLRMYSAVGKKVPAHATGLGKAILAFVSQENISQIIDEDSLKEFTDRTITSADQLREELKTIRDRGYAIDNAEHEKEIRCVAAPVFDHKCDVIAGVSVAVPAAQFSRSELEQFVEPLKETAQNISAKMGKDSI